MKAYKLDLKQLTGKKETKINVNKQYEGERIEEKIERITVNKEPITDGAPITYTERKDGVKPEYNIKTDKWEVALDAMGVVDKTHKTRRADAIKAREEAKKQKEESKALPTQGTNEKIGNVN